MTQHQKIDFPRFYITAPSPCPYLEGRMERKIFTRLRGDSAVGINDALTQLGFRRSQNIVYRPSCEGCSACVSVRVVVDDFEGKGSFRRILRANADVASTQGGLEATREQFALLRRYLDTRHPEGGMSDMDPLDYRMMVEDSPVNTTMVEFRDAGGTLLASCLTDVMSDGLSMVYSFFDPDRSERSLGTYMVLWHIAEAQRRNLPYVYLGYWIAGCRKMNYKTRFRPLEILGPEGWAPLPDHGAEG